MVTIYTNYLHKAVLFEKFLTPKAIISGTLNTNEMFMTDFFNEYPKVLFVITQREP